MYIVFAILSLTILPIIAVAIRIHDVIEYHASMKFKHYQRL